jgi:hypothetical protein
MRNFCLTKTFVLSLASLVAFSSTGCQSPAPNASNSSVSSNGSAGVNTSNLSSSSGNTNVANTNLAAANSVMIETNEPEQYQAKITLRLETMGEQKPNFPPLAAQVARKGTNQRMELAIPGGEKVIYLDRADKHFLLLPDRKQYAELNKESLGVDVRQLLTPGMVVEQVKKLKGAERVGEEQFNGRTVIKYRINNTTNTKSQAGNVNTESIVLVDKETSLPLRSETVSQSENGNVQGVSGLRIVTEMSDIQTVADENLFKEPTELKKVAPEEVRNQVNAVLSVAGTFLGQMLKQNPNTSASPANSPTPQ